MRAVRSPAAPKMTITQGSPCFPMRGSAVVGCSANCAIVESFKIFPGLLCGLLLACTGFHVPAEFLPHSGKHLVREGMLLPRPETHVQRRGQHFRGDGFLDCRLDCPAPFPGILHITLVF